MPIVFAQAANDGAVEGYGPSTCFADIVGRSIIADVDFRWNAHNLRHISEHGVGPEEAEYVVRHARGSYPCRAGRDKWRVWGQTRFGWYLQVVFLRDDATTVYVIHARPLTGKEKRAFRR